MIKKINIAGVNHTIEVCKIPEKGEMGLYVELDSTIKLSDLITKDHRRYILMHEITHGIEVATGIDLKESQVIALSRGLLDTLDRNPEVRKFLFGGNK